MHFNHIYKNYSISVFTVAALLTSALPSVIKTLQTSVWSLEDAAYKGVSSCC